MSTILQSNASYKLELRGTTGSKKVMTDQNQNETGVVDFNKNKSSKPSFLFFETRKMSLWRNPEPNQSYIFEQWTSQGNICY
jgi:hypothetical protein